jgi:hypothetical protein
MRARPLIYSAINPVDSWQDLRTLARALPRSALRGSSSRFRPKALAMTLPPEVWREGFQPDPVLAFRGRTDMTRLARLEARGPVSARMVARRVARVLDVAKLRWRIERDYGELKAAGLARFPSRHRAQHGRLRLPDLEGAALPSSGSLPVPPNLRVFVSPTTVPEVQHLTAFGRPHCSRRPFASTP